MLEISPQILNLTFSLSFKLPGSQSKKGKTILADMIQIAHKIKQASNSGEAQFYLTSSERNFSSGSFQREQ